MWNLTSVKRVLLDVDNLFRTSSSSWKSIALTEWIPQALGLMGVRTNYELKYQDKEASQYKITYPCNFKYIVGAVWNGYRLPISKKIPFKFKDGGVLQYPTATEHRIDMYPGLGHTTFETGTVRFYYLDFPKDEEGFIMIPDNEYLLVALRQYVLYMLILGRYYEHPQIPLQKAENDWETKKDEAINYLSFPSPEEMVAWRDLRNDPILFDVDRTFYEI